MRVLLDTNFMLVPFTSKADIYSALAGYELLTLRDCMNELKGVLPAAALLANKKGVKVVDDKLSSRSVDDRLIEFAKKHNTYIATIDKELKSRCKKSMIPVLTMRQARDVVRV
jgi:rRNA-processing protein FCF1